MPTEAPVVPSGIERIPGLIGRYTGEVSGPSAPGLFREHGGPVTQALVLGAIAGLPTYGATLAFGSEPNDRRRRRQALRRGLLASVLAGATQIPEMRSNYAAGGVDALNYTPQDWARWEAHQGSMKASSVGRHNMTLLVKASNWRSGTAVPAPGAGAIDHGFASSGAQNLILSDPYLPPAVASGLSRIVDYAEPGRSGLVTGGDIARAAIGAGMGYAAASGLGATMSSIFDLPIQQRKRLQAAGLVAGALVNAWRR